MVKNKVLVTSALPYVNNVPHLGNMVCVLSADVYTRYLRLRKIPVIYVLGTDEHGTTTETRAIKESLTPREVCDKYAKIHKKIYDWFECSPDCWGRSSSKENAELSQDIFLKLAKNGYIKEGEVEQAWCPSCKRFLSDRYILGECPFCGYTSARGDQCEKCGKLLEPKQLVNPRCELCSGTPVFKNSKHLFIDLPKIEPKLREWIAKSEKKWSLNAKTMTQAWLKEGLLPRCITRDLQWGIPVPYKGFEGKVFYSWFDAPIAYIGITKENLNEWKDWWLNSSKVRLVQFMGKDNIPFHTILFPASLIGSGDDYTLLDEISVNEYLNYEGGMFSKSKGVGVFGDDAMESKVPADIYRYYLMVNRPERADTEFSWQDFKDKNNRELVANLGNLVYRTLSFIARFRNGELPKPAESKPNDAHKFLEQWKLSLGRIDEAMEAIELKKALREIMELSSLGNWYFQTSEPWKSGPEVADTALYLLANLLKDLSILLFPFMPKSAEEIQKQLQLKEPKWADLGKLSLQPGDKILEPAHMFNKMEDNFPDIMRAKHSGQQQAAHPFSKIDLRVAEILEVREHPSANKLFIEKISLGTETRQIVSGLRGYFNADELVGKHIVVVANLEPAVLRGEKSDGMLLAALSGKDLKLVLAPKSKPGEPVGIKGIIQTPAKIVNISEFKEAELSINGKQVYSKGKGPLQSASETLAIDMSDGTSVS